ncbi:alpha/beta fold hydrolase [Aquincola sp. MAHUQ-54]|uniref:Alpha/beta fold hydrolase n=1 Tax=Aquincola agrisoli TaxID=3119538 RepID=A0AAW9Q7U9_9BURK
MRIDVGRENSTLIELQVDDFGHGPPVVLLHGWPLSGRVWEPQLPALLAAGRRVLAVDRRGFGGSTRCSLGFDLDTLAEDLGQVLERLAPAGAVVVAHDLGAAELLRYLGSFGGERLRAAVLVVPPPPTPETPAPAPPPPAPRAAMLRHWIDEAHAPPSLPLARRLDADARHALWLDAIANGPLALHASRATLDAADLRDDLPRIDVPTLVLHGEADMGRPPAGAAALAAALAGARVERLAEAPRGLLWTHADEVNAALLAFLAAVAPAPPAGGR